MHNPEKAADRKAQRQQEFLRVLEETGSEVKARRAADVGGRTVRKWQEDPEFLDRFNDAIAAARDAVVQKSRQLALAGSESQLNLWMKLAHAELRPGTNLAVGVQVNGTDPQARFAKLPDDQLIERVRRILDDDALRRQAGIDIVEVVEAPGGALLPDERAQATEPASEAPAGAGEAAEPSAEDLI